MFIYDNVHTIATTSTQAGAEATRYAWYRWSDGGAISHSVTVPASTTVYNAVFITQYRLFTAVSPAGAGTVTPPSGDFFAANSVITIGATPNAGFVFSGWMGPVASHSSASTTVTMTAPASVTAKFAASASATQSGQDR